MTLALLAAASAFGQQRLVADIPFEFNFANRVMPAGHYDVTQSPSGAAGVLLVQCSKCQAAAFSVSFKIDDGDAKNAKGRLVFNKYGDTYFLAQVWSSGNSAGFGLDKSKTEREIARVAPGVAHIAIAARTGAAALAGL